MIARLCIVPGDSICQVSCGCFAGILVSVPLRYIVDISLVLVKPWQNRHVSACFEDISSCGFAVALMKHPMRIVLDTFLLTVLLSPALRLIHGILILLVCRKVCSPSTLN